MFTELLWSYTMVSVDATGNISYVCDPSLVSYALGQQPLCKSREFSRLLSFIIFIPSIRIAAFTKLTTFGLVITVNQVYCFILTDSISRFLIFPAPSRRCSDWRHLLMVLCYEKPFKISCENLLWCDRSCRQEIVWPIHLKIVFVNFVHFWSGKHQSMINELFN